MRSKVRRSCKLPPHRLRALIMTLTIDSKLKPAKLVFEMAEDVIFPGYVSRKNWTGFADAYFDAEVWATIIQWFDGVDLELIDALRSQEPEPSGLFSLGLGFAIYEA